MKKNVPPPDGKPRRACRGYDWGAYLSALPDSLLVRIRTPTRTSLSSSVSPFFNELYWLTKSASLALTWNLCGYGTGSRVVLSAAILLLRISKYCYQTLVNRPLSVVLHRHSGSTLPYPPSSPSLVVRAWRPPSQPSWPPSRAAFVDASLFHVSNCMESTYHEGEAWRGISAVGYVHSLLDIISPVTGSLCRLSAPSAAGCAAGWESAMVAICVWCRVFNRGAPRTFWCRIGNDSAPPGESCSVPFDSTSSIRLSFSFLNIHVVSLFSNSCQLALSQLPY